MVVVGPAQLDCRHGGLFFYGIHAAEAACAVALAGATGPLPEDVTAELKGDEVVVRARLAGCRIELRLLDAPPGEGDFQMDLGDGERVLGLPEDYLAPVSSVIAGVMAGTPETGLGAAVAATALLEAVSRSSEETDRIPFL
ncbi:hypothetical protein LKO27_07690 [Tessaracoccus sp. OS52]|uniref:hypothetical protein n=1 Tax=Tessaracoccus sp. OS52 TaxID=2886691 RepID=UPI001D11E8AD|nr:hypothetical protein [Tessaracoccus sp. OS52]MCC2593290.1 hypothetical protein [Tessaracoccus sp. OS52]